MSVVDPVMLGEVIFTPSYFNGSRVTIDVTHIDRSNDEPIFVTAGHADGGHGSFDLPIQIWETLQACRTSLDAYNALINSGITQATGGTDGSGNGASERARQPAAGRPAVSMAGSGGAGHAPVHPPAVPTVPDAQAATEG